MEAIIVPVVTTQLSMQGKIGLVKEVLLLLLLAHTHTHTHSCSSANAYMLMYRRIDEKCNGGK